MGERYGMAPNRVEEEIPEAWVTRIREWDDAQAKAQKRQARTGGSSGNRRVQSLI